MGEWRSVDGRQSCCAMIEHSMCEMQKVMTSLDAYVAWVYCTMSHLVSAILTWTLEIVGHVVSRSHLGV